MVCKFPATQQMSNDMCSCVRIGKDQFFDCILTSDRSRLPLIETGKAFTEEVIGGFRAPTSAHAKYHYGTSFPIWFRFELHFSPSHCRSFR